MKAIIYLRVSTDWQNTESQLGAIQKRANERGYEVLEIVEEKLSGGLAMDSRPGIVKLRQLIQTGIGTVLIYDVSRVGRDLFESIKLIRELTYLGVNVHITDLSVNTLEGGKESPSTTLMINMMLSMAEYQRSQIREKVKLGVDNFRRKHKRWGRSKGSVKDIGAIRKEYKGVVKDLTKNPDWSLRLISRNRNVSVSTVAKVRDRLEAEK